MTFCLSVGFVIGALIGQELGKLEYRPKLERQMETISICREVATGMQGLMKDQKKVWENLRGCTVMNSHLQSQVWNLKHGRKNEAKKAAARANSNRP